MPNSRFTVPLITVAAIFVLAYFVLRPAFVDPENRPLPPAVFKLRRIEVALAQYFHEHNRFPASDHGYRHALYSLHHDIAAADFQLDEDSDSTAPYWSHKQQMLVGGDLVYLNQPISERYPARILMYAKLPMPQRVVWVVRSDFFGRTAAFSKTPDNSILGSFESDDGFYLPDIDVFRDFALTHKNFSSSQTVNNLLISSHGHDVTVTYNYSSGRLSGCVVQLSSGQIREQFTTDSLGQVLSVDRSPANWREFLSKTAR